MNETVPTDRGWIIGEEEEEILDTDDEEEGPRDLSWIEVPDDEELVGTRVRHRTTPMLRRNLYGGPSPALSVRWP